MLGGFSYGYWATQILGGILAQTYGANCVNLIACGGSIKLGLMVPTAANIDITLLTMLRAVQGAFQGATTLAMFILLSKWLPEAE